MLTDLMVYDWWALILGFAGEEDEDNDSDARVDKQIKWIGELMTETNTRALPRSMEQLGRCYDTLEFWTTCRSIFITGSGENLNADMGKLP